MKQLESGFERTINCNKYHPKLVKLAQNSYLNYLVNRSFQGVNRLSLLFENVDDRQVHTKYFMSNVEIKDYNVVIDGRNFFDQPKKKMI